MDAAESFGVVVVGGGQAGLAASHELAARGVDHVVLERGRVGETWRRRWDSFCLVTPNWSCRLPGHAYDGDDPDGFMPRDEIVGYLERYAAAAPVREGIDVHALAQGEDGAFALETSAGPLRADAVVVATGTYRRPHRPAAAAAIPADVLVLGADDYRSPAELPDGRVLVVGSGQTGCQLAEELHLAGRDVVLACGRAPWLPRRIGGRDLLWWLLEAGFMDVPPEALPGPAARLTSNVLATGHGGGHDLHLRTLRELGVALVGRLEGVDGHTARFAGDLDASVAWGDDAYRELGRLVARVAAERGLDAELPEPPPFDAAAATELDLRDVAAVIVTSGFRPDFGSWIHVPEAFDDHGFPRQRGGASTAAPGLFFLGVHFMRTRRSALLCGVGDDAAVVAEQVAARRSAADDRAAAPTDAHLPAAPG